MLKAQQLFQTGWLLAVLPLILLALARGTVAATMPWLIAWVALGLSTIALWLRPRAGIRASAALAVFVAVVSLPWVLYNLFAYGTDHPLYLDSPATIFIVLLSAALTALPALTVLVLSFVNRGVAGAPARLSVVP